MGGDAIGEGLEGPDQEKLAGALTSFASQQSLITFQEETRKSFEIAIRLLIFLVAMIPLLVLQNPLLGATPLAALGYPRGSPLRNLVALGSGCSGLGAAAAGALFGLPAGPFGVIGGFAIGAVASLVLSSREKRKAQDATSLQGRMNRVFAEEVLKSRGYTHESDGRWHSGPDVVGFVNDRAEGHGQKGTELARSINQTAQAPASTSLLSDHYWRGFMRLFPETGHASLYEDMKKLGVEIDPRTQTLVISTEEVPTLPSGRESGLLPGAPRKEPWTKRGKAWFGRRLKRR